jgi:hypothetical protein
MQRRQEMTEEERALRERWGDLTREIPEGNFLLKECAIKLSYEPGANGGLSPEELLEKVRQGIEQITESEGGKLLAGPRKIDGLYVFLAAFPIAIVAIVDMSGAVPPGTIPGDTINQN